MTTIEEVAKEAGVSRGTVSNVLNNYPSVSEENREKVLKAINKLKYTPNRAARMLKTKISKSIGLVIPNISNPFYPELARGVEDAGRKAGYSVFLCNSDRDIAKEREYMRILIEKNVDGIILVKPGITAEEIDEVGRECRIVLVDTDEELSQRYDVINVDDYGGVSEVMNLLYDYGHERIAFIYGQLQSNSSRRRLAAYKDFFARKNVTADSDLIKEGSYDWYSGYSRTVELLRKVDPPTAVFAANDLMAIGAVKAIRERRMNIPLDISVVGYDDIDLAALYSPQLTTVRQPKYEMGVMSIEALLRRLGPDGKSDAGEGSIATLKTNVVLRETVGYARRDRLK